MKMQTTYIEHLVLRQTYKKGPLGRTTQHKKVASTQRIRSRPTYQCPGRPKAVASGASRGSTDPALVSVQVHFGGKLYLILLKSVANVSF